MFAFSSVAGHNPNLESVEGIILFSHLYMLKSSEN